MTKCRAGFATGHEYCMKFISKVRECKSDNYTLVNIVKEVSYDPVHEYNLRNNNPTKLLNPRTERFKRFITIKYDFKIINTTL